MREFRLSVLAPQTWLEKMFEVLSKVNSFKGLSSFLFLFLQQQSSLFDIRKQKQKKNLKVLNILSSRGRIFSHVRPSYEQAVSDLDRSMNISLWI